VIYPLIDWNHRTLRSSCSYSTAVISGKEYTRSNRTARASNDSRPIHLLSRPGIPAPQMGRQFSSRRTIIRVQTYGRFQGTQRSPPQLSLTRQLTTVPIGFSMAPDSSFGQTAQANTAHGCAMPTVQARDNWLLILHGPLGPSLHRDGR
jgi:hypothetical protein